MGNQQDLSPRVAEKGFEAVFPSYMGRKSQWGDTGFAIQRWRVQSPCGPRTHGNFVVQGAALKISSCYWNLQV